VFFLALSGFSLALAPARNRWRTGSVAQFAGRRAWRILPPYWAALGVEAELYLLFPLLLLVRRRWRPW